MVIEDELILNAVSAYPGGASLQDVMDSLSISMPKRTLQRRLSDLVTAGKLNIIGSQRFRRYLVINQEPSQTPIPLSQAGLSLQQALRQDKPSMGYDRHFLDEYQPNVTHYLTQSEREQLREWGTPMGGLKRSGTFVKKILNHLLLDLSWNSSRLEGNTYSLLETERLLQSGEAADNKDPLETQMLLNHKAAIEYLIDEADTLKINTLIILNLHALLSDNLLSDPAACGRLRTIPVGIAKTKYNPTRIPQLIQECFEQIVMKAQAIHDPYEQSFFLIVHLPYLQPFEDVNKRVSRLAANIPFIRDNLCPLSFIDVPQSAYIDGVLGVYEFNRIELLRDIYLWAYQRSCQKYATLIHTTGEPDPVSFKYRQHIGYLVREVVNKHMTKNQAIILIAEQAEQHIPQVDRERFIEKVDRELMGLHTGNLVRFQLKPETFERWYRVWTAKPDMPFL